MPGDNGGFGIFTTWDLAYRYVCGASGACNKGTTDWGGAITFLANLLCLSFLFRWICRSTTAPRRLALAMVDLLIYY